MHAHYTIKATHNAAQEDKIATMMAIYQFHSIQLQKIYNPDLRKGWGPLGKTWNRPKNGCNGGIVMPKIVIMMIQVIFCQILVKHGDGITNAPELLLLNVLPLAYHHSQFLTAPLDITFFSQQHSLGLNIFFTTGLFGLDNYKPNFCIN